MISLATHARSTPSGRSSAPTAATASGDGHDHPLGPAPRRVLVVSADMGGGHEATARALAEVVHDRWPLAQVAEVDTLDAMGSWVGRAFRWIYVTNVNTTPWLYDFFYHCLVHQRWFAQASKRFVGEWSGRALAPVLERERPDVVLSTYPLGTAGLQWLRTQRGLTAPVGAWVSDAAPHPFWVYRDVDLHLVVHEEALAPALRAEPDAAVAVCAPMVTSRFRPSTDREERAAERARLGLDEHALVALVSTGVYAFGDVEAAVDAVLAVPGAAAVVACGRNERLRARLEARGLPRGRLRPLGWVDEMPAWLRAVDVVVTNAGGATSLEALACGTPVLMHDPIAGHGRANAALMDRAGLAVLCPAQEDLRAQVADLVARPQVLEGLRATVAAHVAAHDLGSALVALAAAVPGGGTPLFAGSPAVRPVDALFLHAQGPRVAQQVGAVVELGDDAGPGGQAPGDAAEADRLRAVVAERLAAVPALRRRLVPRGALLAPRWAPAPVVDPAAHVDVVDAGDADDGLAGAVDAFFTAPLDPARPLWAARVVTGAGAARLLVKVHHAVGDGAAVTTALEHALDPAPRRGGPPTGAATGGRVVGAGRGAAAPAGPGHLPAGARRAVEGAARAGRGAAEVASGLWHLGRAGTAGPSALTGPLVDGRRHVVVATLPAPQVRATARRHGVSPTVLLTALVAEGVHRLLRERDPRPADARLRAIVPVALPPVGAGNAVGAVRADLPVGPAAPAERLAAVAAALREGAGHGQPRAARAVVRAAGLLPWALGARAARAAYGGRWFHTIVTTVPGRQRPAALGGRRVAAVAPVVPLAEGVGLAVGFLPWGRGVGVGITAAPRLVPDADALPAAMAAALDDLADAHPWPGRARSGADLADDAARPGGPRPGSAR